MRKQLTLGLILCLMVALMSGCSNESTSAVKQNENQPSGTLVLKVNPELELTYNQEGLVTSIDGLNDDGKQISSLYTDYIGKPCTTVLSDLVGIIESEGYFVNTTDQEKMITIELSKGSYLPNEEFIYEITTAVQNTVNNMSQSKPPVVLNNHAKRNTSTNVEMSKDVALEIALNHAKLSIDQVNNISAELEDGKTKHYDVEFESTSLEYSYEIDANDGSILKVRTEKADVEVAISEDEALQIALNNAGLSSSAVKNIDVDLDDNDQFYDVSFETDDTEYIYKIDASTGAILSVEKEVDNDDDILDYTDDDEDDDAHEDDEDEEDEDDDDND